MIFSGNTYDDCLLAKVETVYSDSGDHGSSMVVSQLDPQFNYIVSNVNHAQQYYFGLLKVIS